MSSFNYLKDCSFIEIKPSAAHSSYETMKLIFYYFSYICYNLEEQYDFKCSISNSSTKSYECFPSSRHFEQSI